MSVGNVPSNSSGYQTAWNKALEYLDNLPPARQKVFNGLRPEQRGLFRRAVSPAEITGLLKQAGASKRSVLRLNKISTNFMQPFSRFSTVIDTVVQLNPGIGSPVWAPIKIILMIVIPVAEGFAQIEASLKDTLEKLPLFDEYEKVFRASNPQSLGLVHDALAKFYVDVIDLTLVTAGYYHRGVFRSIFRSAVKDFGGDLGEVILSMKGHVDAVNPVVVLGGIVEARQHHEDVTARLRTLNIKADQKTTHDLDKRQFSVKKWLSRTNVDANRRENQGRHLSGTSDWFFQNPDFRSWRNSKNSSHLWVRGIPGCGKSVLSSVLIGQLEQKESVIYFFCKENDKDRNNPLSILRTFLWQLLHHSVHPIQSAIFDIVHETMLKNGTSFADSIIELWGPLERIIGILPTVYCVIDGLDECDNKGELVDFLARLTKLSSSATAFKIFATCRLNEPRIESQLGVDQWHSVVIEESSIENDISAYIKHRIKDSEALKIHEDKVYDSVYRGAGGMFLWARLMLDDLAGKSSWELEKALEDMPQGLDDVYELLLKRPLKSSAERCRKVLHWSAIARQPLSVDELAVALAVSGGLSSHEAYMSGLNRAFEIQRIQKDCGSLITILEDETVQLVHTSLRTYLLKINDPSNSHSSVFSINPDQAHMSLAAVCIQYNMFTCFQDDVAKLGRESIKTLYPFLRYCTCNWIHHVVLSGNHRGYEGLLDIMAKFFDSKQGWRWLHRCDMFGVSIGHLLAFQGDLRLWITTAGRGSQDGGGDFILHISEHRYKECRQKYGEESIETIEAAHEVARFCEKHDRYPEALEWYRRELAGREKTAGKEHPSTLLAIKGIADVFSSLGRYPEALEWYGRELAVEERNFGKEHESALDTVHYMAGVFDEQGRYSEALEWYERALAGKEKVLGKEHRSTLNTLKDMAGVFRNQGRYPEALEWYGRVLTREEKAHGKEHPRTADTVGRMASVLENQGRYSEALEWYERALIGFEKVLGKEHPSTLSALSDMVGVFVHRRQYSEALEQYGRALAGFEKTLGKEHPLTLSTVHSMAKVFHKQGQYPEALEWYERALAGEEKVLGKEHPSTLGTAKDIGGVFYDQGQYPEALEWYERALAGEEKVLGKEHESTLNTLNDMAGVFYDEGRYPEALEWYGRVLAGYEKTLGKENVWTLLTIRNMVDVLKKQGRYSEALEWYARVLDVEERNFGKEHESALDTVHEMAGIFVHQGRYSEALEWYERALVGREKTLGKEDSWTLDTARNLETLRKRVETSNGEL